VRGEAGPDALVSAGGQSSSQVLLVATADPADRTVVALDRDGAAFAAISAIISVSAITSIVVSVVTRLRAHSHAAERSINGNLS
jgi:sugar (pentulose or hexulose) kinase